MSSGLFEQLRDDIKRGDAIAVRRFLEHNGNPNLSNALGESLLTIAARVGQTRLVELLLLAGAHVNYHSEPHTGWTALYASSMNGHGKTVEVLLKHGADPKIPMRGQPIAYWVSLAHAEYREILELLNAQSS
jgi:ankyrin repeat protein